MGNVRQAGRRQLSLCSQANSSPDSKLPYAPASSCLAASVARSPFSYTSAPTIILISFFDATATVHDCVMRDNTRTVTPSEAGCCVPLEWLPRRGSRRGSGTRGPHRPSHPAELLVETAELGHRACMPDPETSPLHALRWPRETSIVSSGALKIVSHPRRYRIRVAEVKVASERVGIQI